ncbi:DUF423 domain-containing protein [Thiohalocapsa sp. ML1]|jgi:uncharacterized membrane protein YgdD (TMEM256/DUF423 family)|uniref:DUF423 domain-containing protein n=1 Tax=Thiohalocapsa sp. ML1 TaxID=1431688 RepID=UPI000731FAF2|nr:DUF423 domain-containing protein [Thiohalocapsa sp. ML1]
MHRTLFAIATTFGLAAVLLGAFGAHGLEGQVSAERLTVWETGAHYLGWHATTLLVIALLGVERLGPPARIAGWIMAGGAALFSGSLFLLVLTDTPALGAITPFGGLALAASWGLLLFAAVRGTGPTRCG